MVRSAPSEIAPEGAGRWVLERAATTRRARGAGPSPVAELVLGLGSSHTPQLSSGPAVWPDHGEREARVDGPLGGDGEHHPYAEPLAGAAGRLEGELSAEVLAAKSDRAQAAVAALAGELVDLPPTPERAARTPAHIRAAGRAIHAEDPDPCPVDAACSAHLAERLTEGGFDLTVRSDQPAGRSLGHAITFGRRRLGLDRSILGALAPHDGATLAGLPPRLLRPGTSEALNSVVAGGAPGGTRFELVDHVHGYRSLAVTGVGMAFAAWRTGPAVDDPHRPAPVAPTAEAGAGAR